MVFASEANSTYATIIDDFFTAKQGSFVESTPVGKHILTKIYLEIEKIDR